VIEIKGADVRITARTAEANIGELSIGRTENGFRIGWQSRDIDTAHSLARRMSHGPAEAERALLESSDVVIALKLLDEQQYLVQMRGSEKWAKFAPDVTPSADIKEGWSSRVADLKPGSRNVNVVWLEDSAVHAEFGKQGWFQIPAGEIPGSPQLPQLTARGPPASAQALSGRYGDTLFPARYEAGENAVFLKCSDLPSALRDDIGKLGRGAKSGSEIVFAPSPATPELTKRVHSQLTQRSYSELAREITSNPTRVKAAIDDHFASGLDSVDGLISSGDSSRALLEIDNLIAAHGRRSELLIRKGIAQLDRGRLDAAARSLSPAKSAKNPEAFFDEITQRLNRENPSPGETENLHRLIDLSEWRSCQDRGLVPTGEVSAFRQGERVCLKFQTKKLPEVTPVNPADAARSGRPIYVQDSPALNNLDWNVSFERSLDQAVSGSLGDVVMLHRADLGYFKPTEIYTTANETGYHRIRGAVGQGAGASRASRPDWAKYFPAGAAAAFGVAAAATVGGGGGGDGGKEGVGGSADDGPHNEAEGGSGHGGDGNRHAASSGAQNDGANGQSARQEVPDEDQMNGEENDSEIVFLVLER
jgi:hypothetical protein